VSTQQNAAHNVTQTPYQWSAFHYTRYTPPRTMKMYRTVLLKHFWSWLRLLSRSVSKRWRGVVTSVLAALTVGNIRCVLTGERSPNIFTASLTDANGAVVSISAMVQILEAPTRKKTECTVNPVVFWNVSSTYANVALKVKTIISRCWL
jgi:hypothetical protein